MARDTTADERDAMVRLIIEEVKIIGRLKVSQVVEMFQIHRNTAERYFLLAEKKGGLIRYGRLGLFRDHQAVIEFDLKRFSSRKESGTELPDHFRGSAVTRRTIDILRMRK